MRDDQLLRDIAAYISNLPFLRELPGQREEAEMSYLQIGWIIGIALTHLTAGLVGVWWNDRKWRQLLQRLAD